MSYRINISTHQHINKTALPVLGFCFLAFTCSAQSLAGRKAVLRYEIDAKRTGVDVNSEDALPRSREFLRIDSTYYVGWMFEGAYKYNHAADYPGFKNASVPLERALRTMERDYGKELKTRTSDLMVYFPVFKYHLDYTLIANYLMNCYSNMDEPDKVFALLRRVIKLNFQRDFYMDAYNYLGWTVHRNRFYTSAKYPFLKNSIDENEKLAMKYLDSSMRKIYHDYFLNSKIFQPGYERPDKLAVYHYKSMLYAYTFNIDSAARYYELMRQGGSLPHNNYATFRAICGDFRTAENEYQKASAQDGYDKRLQEWVYYSSILDIYKGLPKAGIQLTKDMIKANGSTPGFGWYNIAEARCLLYDGQTSEALRYANKAAEFKETHIGTTLGQTHYDFSVQLIKLQQKIQEIEAQKFEHKNWWHNPAVLGKIAQLTAEKYLQQFLIINQFAQNPERDRVVYKLFSTESTVSWDEIWYLIRDFSTNFFLDRFNKELSTDKRTYIRKYFQYYAARLMMEKGAYRAASDKLNAVLRDPTLDAEYEKLLIARALQAQAECAKELDKERDYNDRMYKMYRFYPQLIPYTALKMNMRLNMNNAPEGFESELKSLNIHWTNSSNIEAPQAYIRFTGGGDKRKIEYYVIDESGKEIVARQTMIYKNSPEQAAKDLGYRLFNIGGKMPDVEEQENETGI